MTIKQWKAITIMKEIICKNCKHFRLHYIKLGRSYREILYGHCVYPRLKRREATTKGCHYFKERPEALS